MRSQQSTSKAQEAKPRLSSSSPKPYPVSTRAYRKKDYDYLMNFPSAAVPPSLRPSSSGSELSLDGASVSSFSATTRSTDFGTSSSLASSVGRYRKDVMDVESSPHLFGTQANTDSAHEHLDLPRSHLVAEDEKHEKVTHLEEEKEMVHNKSAALAPPEEVFVGAEMRQKTYPKARPRRPHTIWSLCCKTSVSDSLTTG